MAENNTLNMKFPIYTTENGAQVSFPVGETQLVLRKATYENVMMSFGDKITGDVYYKDNSLVFSMKEYIIYDGVKYRLVNPPTVVRNGVASEASADGALTKYTFEFYHPMYMLANYPFSDVAVTQAENQYLSESKDFSWVGNPVDFVAKINSNLRNTHWKVELGNGFPQTKLTKMSEVLSFKEQTVADAIKTFYDTWEVPFTFESITDAQTEDYQQGKRFKVVFGLPVNEIYATAEDRQQDNPFVFQFGKGVGLKNNSRTPKNNQIVTRLSGCGSENNIPYGYPQIPWRGNENAKFTYGNHAGLYENVTIGETHFDKVVSYPLYMGVYEGQWVKLIKHPFTRKKLMPSSYRASLINKVSPYVVFVEDENTHRLVAPQETTVNEDYDPDKTLIDYIDAESDEHTTYPNPIVTNDPSYSFHEFEKIKPELNPDRDIATNIDDNEYGEEHFAIVNAYPLTVDGLPAQQWISDLKEDSEEYKQSYFAMTLPVLPFDLYACASITEEMQIYMRTGACQGCTFNVKIDWENYKSNFFDGEGNFAPDHARRNTQTYPNSKEQQITLILEKDLQTFGTLMPNEYQNPSVGDEFVILGISLPQTYILDAEQRLDKAMEAYLRENNEYHYEYPLKFDEHFLATHPYILEQLKPNCLLRFMYANEEHHLYVKQMTVKYGDKPLPQYDITLAEDMEVVLNQLGEVQEDVSRIDSALSILQQTYGSNIWLEIAKKLSKTQDDTAQGRIRFLKGLQLGEKFNSGLLGEGGVLRVDADGKTYFEVDKMYARVKAIFDTVEVRKDTHTTGNRIVSNAGMKCTRVVWYDSNDAITDNINNVAYFRCYFRGDDGDKSITNDFQLHDLAYCHETTANNGSVVQRSYWREVVGVGSTIVDEELYIDLGNVNTEQYAQYDIHNADTPMPQDNIIQLGNTQSTERQGAIMEYVNGADAPRYSIYQNLNDFSLAGKNYISLGYDSSTGKAYFNVNGDAYIGDPNGSTFVKYEQNNSETHSPLLTIKAKIDAQSPYGGSTLGAVLNNMQSQIDGAIDSWFYAGEPTPSNPPANSWTTNSIKDQHLGDLYYDTNNGYAYRFAYEGSTYKWMPIKDTDVTTALANAAQAQRTADEKCRTYIGATAPQPPYNVGDFWVNATWSGLNGNSQTVSYSNDILKCVTAKGENGSFSIDDWSLASKYTSDEKFDSYIRQILNGGNNASGDALTVASALRAIRGALNNGTLIDGGLMLTSLIGMRQRNANGTYTTWAGMNGEYDNSEDSISHEYNGAKGHGIAAWYGGAMADIEDVESYLTTDELAEYNSMTATQKATYLRSNRFAKSLLRFDGSGYLAGGSITWDNNGEVTISNVYSNIGNDTLEWSGETLQGLVNLLEQLPFTLQNGSHLFFDPQASFWHLEVQGKTVATQEWVNKNYITKSFFDSLFQLYNDTTKIDANGTIPSSSKLNIQAMFGFWTEQYISSLGRNSSGGSGGSSSGGIDLVAMWSALNGNTNEQINASHLTNALANYVTSSALASALADYLTSADLDGYATVSALNALATAVSNLASVARSGSYNDLTNKPSIPSKTSDLTNDSGFLTQHQDISGKADKNEMSVTAGTGANADKTTIQLKSGTSATVLTQHQSLTNYVDKTSAQTINGKKTFKEISFVEYGVQSSANPYSARMFNSADGWGGSAYLQLGGSNSGGNAENAIGFYILNRQWSNIILSLTNAGNFNISGTISEGGTQLSQKYLGINSTASKATQLANSRTLWGQSFNGTQDVSGNMSGVGSLSMNGVLSGARGEIKNWNQLANKIGRYKIYQLGTASYVTIPYSTLTNGHKYVWRLGLTATAARSATIHALPKVRVDLAPNTTLWRSGIIIPDADNLSVIIDSYSGSTEQVGEYIEVTSDLIVDLTAMFGAGNEPSTPNEFARRLGYASIDDVPYIPYTPTPVSLNNGLSIGGDLVVQGNKVILANGLVLNYNKSTNTLTFENTDGEPCNIVATGGVTALG